MDSSEIFTKLVEYVKTDVVEQNKCSTITPSEFYEGFKKKIHSRTITRNGGFSNKSNNINIIERIF